MERPVSESRARRARSAGLRAGLVALSAALLAACATAPPPPAPIPPTYRIGPPDILSVSVLPDPVIARRVTVRPDGFITFDLIGDVRASGRTAAEVAQDIERRIARFKRDARATVIVEDSRSDKISVYGEVRSVGSMPLASETRVAEAIALRGGPTNFAWESRVRIIRTDGETTEVLRVNLTAIKRGNLETNLLIEAGDIIVVPPTPLASFGYFLQSIVFPFNTIIGPGLSGANLIAN